MWCRERGIETVRQDISSRPFSPPQQGHGRRGCVALSSVLLSFLLGANRSLADPTEAGRRRQQCEKRAQSVAATKVIFPCSPGPCVSTASFNKPSQYSSPWIVPEGTSLVQARNQLEQVLQDLGASVVSCLEIGRSKEEGEGEGGEQVAVFVLAAKADGWGEEMKFLLKEDRGLGGVGLVTFTVSAQAQAGSDKKQGGFAGLVGGKLQIPDPPGCFEVGCISGPPQRRYVEAIRNKLGWLPLETDEDKKWVQIMGPFLINPEDYVTAFD